MFIISEYKAGKEDMQATILGTTKLMIDLKNWLYFQEILFQYPTPLVECTLLCDSLHANHHNHNMQFYLLLLTPVCVSIRPCPHPHPPFFEKLEGDTKQVKFWLQTLKSRVISVNKEWFCNKDLVATYIHTSYRWQAHHLHMVAHQCWCSCFSSVGLYNTASVRTHHTTKSMSMLIADDQGPPHSMSVFYA